MGTALKPERDFCKMSTPLKREYRMCSKHRTVDEFKVGAGLVPGEGGAAKMKMSTAPKREHDFGAKWARRLCESTIFDDKSVKISRFPGDCLRGDRPQPKLQPFIFIKKQRNIAFFF